MVFQRDDDEKMVLKSGIYEHGLTELINNHKSFSIAVMAS